MESRQTPQSKVSAKGWVVIPARLRRRFGLRPGTMVEFRATDRGILVTPGSLDPVEELYGKLARKESLTRALLEERAAELKREEANIRTP